MNSVRTDFFTGSIETMATMVANYRCGHCTGHVTGLSADETTGDLKVGVEHDDGCPILTGAVCPIPDTFRAAREQS